MNLLYVGQQDVGRPDDAAFQHAAIARRTSCVALHILTWREKREGQT
jgi:hypothetical protein